MPQKALSILDTLKKLEMQENQISRIQEGDFEGGYVALALQATCQQLSSITVIQKPQYFIIFSIVHE